MHRPGTRRVVASAVGVAAALAVAAPSVSAQPTAATSGNASCVGAGSSAVAPGNGIAPFAFPGARAEISHFVNSLPGPSGQMTKVAAQAHGTAIACFPEGPPGG